MGHPQNSRTSDRRNGGSFGSDGSTTSMCALAARAWSNLKYMHRNPVVRGLVARPEDWPWSSFRHYAMGEIGTVEIESEWTARRREREVHIMKLPSR